MTDSSDLLSSGRTQHIIVVENDLTREYIAQTEQLILEKLNNLENTSVIIDMTSVQRIDSKGFSLCIQISKKCAIRRISLIIKASSQAYKLFCSANLTKHLNIIENIP